jgi:hypothetical protein
MTYYLVERNGIKQIEYRSQPPAEPHHVLPFDAAGVPVEALEQVDAKDQDGEVIKDLEGNPKKIWGKNEEKLKKFRDDEKAAREEADVAEKKRQKDRKDAKDKVKAVDWTKLTTIAELKAVVRDFIESQKD